MPKKKQQEPPEEQSERFRKDAHRMIDVGKLSPTDAEASIERIITTKIKPNVK